MPPESFLPIFNIIHKCVEVTFSGDATVKSSQILNQDIFPLACYPSLHAVCKRGKYEADLEKPLGSCRKIGAHPLRCLGFSVLCLHGSTYFDLS